MSTLSEISKWLADRIDEIGPFDVLARGDDLPVVCFRLAENQPYSVFDFSEHLRERGWIIPAYKMAPDAQDVAVLRVVVREGLSYDLAEQLVDDLRAGVNHLQSQDAPSKASPVPTSRRSSRHSASRGGSGQHSPGEKKVRPVC